jgi:hypothetical protein
MDLLTIIVFLSWSFVASIILKVFFHIPIIIGTLLLFLLVFFIRGIFLYKDYRKRAINNGYYEPVKMKWSLVKKIRLINPNKWNRFHSDSHILIYRNKQVIYFNFIDWVRFCIWDEKRKFKVTHSSIISDIPFSNEKNNVGIEAILNDVQKDIELALTKSQEDIDRALKEQKEILKNWGET